MLIYLLIGLILGIFVPESKPLTVEEPDSGFARIIGYVVIWPLLLPYELVSRIW